jgi:hypothetical protein
MKKYDLKKNPLKEMKFFQDNTFLSVIPSFNTSKNIIFQNPHIKIDLLHGGQNPLSYYIL